jgi:hypothetical protein
MMYSRPIKFERENWRAEVLRTLKPTWDHNIKTNLKELGYQM